MNNFYGKISIAASLAFHLLLILLFIALKYQLIPPESKPLELMQFGFQEINNVSDFSMNQQDLKAAHKLDYKFGQKSNLAPQKVDLPTANIDADENIYIPQSPDAVHNNLDMNEKIGNSYMKSESNISEFLPTDSKEINENLVVPETNDFLSALQARISEGNSSDSPFILEGEISSRQVLVRDIPLYPSGLQKSVSVKIRLQVLPDGKIGEMILIKKAGSPFDSIALEALEKWKFNPISKDIIQSGTIIFIYEMK